MELFTAASPLQAGSLHQLWLLLDPGITITITIPVISIILCLPLDLGILIITSIFLIGIVVIIIFIFIIISISIKIIIMKSGFHYCLLIRVAMILAATTYLFYMANVRILMD